MQDRMFHVLVLGGLALVGCGGSVAAESNGNKTPGPRSSSGSSSDPGTGMSPEASVADAAIVTMDQRGTDAAVEETAALPSSKPVQDAGGVDANGYADATMINPGCRLPCEAPPM